MLLNEFTATIRQIVVHGHVVALRQQNVHNVAADEARPTGKEHLANVIAKQPAST